MDTEQLVRDILEICGSPLLAMTCDRDRVRQAGMAVARFCDDELAGDRLAYELEIKGLRAIVRKLRLDKRLALAVAKVTVRSLAEK